MSDEQATCPPPVEGATTCAEEGNLKRTADAVKMTDPSTSLSKRSKAGTEQEGQEKEVLDLATTFGMKEGDRLEVDWDIGDEDTPEDRVTTHHWGATLLKHDGKTTEDGVAIRVLEYDACPQLGFPEKSKEEIVFTGQSTLVDYETQDELNFRLLSDDDSGVVFLRLDEVEPLVNTILEGALTKAAGNFNGLPRAQQAAIADKVASKKAKLIELLQNHMQEMSGENTANRVVTSADVQRLLAQAMGEE